MRVRLDEVKNELYKPNEGSITHIGINNYPLFN